MENEKMINILKEAHSLLEGHFLLTSGNHSNRYCQCAQLMQYPALAQSAVELIVQQLKGIKVDVVVGPAMGGIVVGYELARQLGARSIFTERVDDKMVLRRGFTINKGDRVLIAEDVITTGKSTVETLDAISPYSPDFLGLACLVDRRPSSMEPLGFKVYSSTTLDVDIFSSSDCPLCKENIPLIQPGSRKKF